MPRMQSMIITPEGCQNLRKERAAKLAAGYTPTKRRFEITNLILFGVCFTGACWNVLSALTLKEVHVVVVACILAMALADFFSGMLHWWFDTWGTMDAFIIGPFIRSFREHHIDPVAITRHDFVETNADTFIPVIPVVAALAYLKVSPGNQLHLFLFTFFIELSFWVAITNQIHKWSHTMEPPLFVKLLQKFGIILSRKNHNIHHHPPYDKYYCITTGWLNEPLGRIGYWKFLEKWISHYTGAVPRADDSNWTSLIVKPKQEDVHACEEKQH